jgi:hypothetical protein
LKQAAFLLENFRCEDIAEAVGAEGKSRAVAGLGQGPDKKHLYPSPTAAVSGRIAHLSVQIGGEACGIRHRRWLVFILNGSLSIHTAS